MGRLGKLLPTMILAAVVGLVACGKSADSASPVQANEPMVLDDSQPQNWTVYQGLPADVLRLRQARIMDPGFFGRDMVALTLMVPADWQDRGAVTWADTMCQIRMQQIQWEAASPDGRERIQIMPAEGWTASRDNMGHSQPDQSGCPDWTFSSLQEFLQAWIAHHRPNARVLDFEIDPEASQAMLASLPQIPSMSGMQYRNRAEAGRLLLAYQENGQEFREMVTTGVVFMHFDMTMPSYGAGPDYQMQSLTGSTLPVFTARAPAGELDFDRFEAFTSTLSINPAYAEEVGRFFAGLNRTRMQGEQDRHQIRMDTINYIGQLNRDSYNSRMDSMDRSSHQFSQTIREVQTWVDPVSREPVELPMHYRNAWRMDDGTYLMTNSDGFDPWRDLQIRGDRMQSGRR